MARKAKNYIIVSESEGGDVTVSLPHTSFEIVKDDVPKFVQDVLLAAGDTVLANLLKQVIHARK